MKTFDKPWLLAGLVLLVASVALAAPKTTGVPKAGKPAYPVPRDRVVILNSYETTVNVDKDTGRMIAGRTEDADAMGQADFVYRQIGKTVSLVVLPRSLSPQYGESFRLLSATGEYIDSAAIAEFHGHVDDGVLWISRRDQTTLDKEYSLIRTDGVTIIPFGSIWPRDWSFHDGRCWVADAKDPHALRLIDRQGRCIIQQDYELVMEFHGQRCFASKGETIFALDMDGKVEKQIAGYKFAGHRDPATGLVPVRNVKTKLVGIMDHDLRLVVDARWTQVVMMNGIAAVTKYSKATEYDYKLPNGRIEPDERLLKWGLIDAKGKRMLGQELHGVGQLANGRCAAMKLGWWGYLDDKGRWVIHPQFHQLSDFNGGFAIVGRHVADDEPDLVEIIDRDGVLIQRTSLIWPPFID